MVRVIHQNVIVQPGGIIEIRRADLPEGATARVTVAVDTPEAAPPSLTSLIGSCTGGFRSADDVDSHIRGLRDELERPWHPKN